MSCRDEHRQRQDARRKWAELKRRLGKDAWGLVTPKVREALLWTEIIGVIAGQDDEHAPLWRMQELIRTTADVMAESP